MITGDSAYGTVTLDEILDLVNCTRPEILVWLFARVCSPMSLEPADCAKALGLNPKYAEVVVNALVKKGLLDVCSRVQILEDFETVGEAQ